ncbi:trimethyllysine dioxygenase, mitochondrial-like [Patiria miniata]|uniref:Trimethyllysine dioxygenase, mitochondrial n=1 Tax=Patiria miniata TaxID=46514 RepID=A0A913ZGA8_PATMI|nr:trimethyllysine dioxygenase, mitochondrial-like [Patiria miniata]
MKTTLRHSCSNISTSRKTCSQSRGELSELNGKFHFSSGSSACYINQFKHTARSVLALWFKLQKKMSESLAVATEQERSVTVKSGDNSWELSYVWLRDHCRCEKCFDHSNFQRLLDTVGIPLDIRPTQLTCGTDGLDLTWPDSHMTTYPWKWLEEFGPSGAKQQSHNAALQRILWDGATIKSVLPPDIAFQEFMETETGLKEAVERFYKLGLVFINGAQPNTEDVEKVASRFSRLQETFYGRACVVTFTQEIADSGYSKGSLSLHTDNTYFHEPNGALLFSCFKHDGEGGENPLVDGFYAAAKLKREHPDYYDALSTIPLVMQYVDQERDIKTHATMIKNDPITGAMQMIRYNVLDRGVLSHFTLRDMDRFYAANKAFATILQDPSSEFVVKLVPGRLMLIDNWRLLHGRSAFTGNRVMTSAYLQRDEMHSKIRTMLGVKI